MKGIEVCVDRIVGDYEGRMGISFKTGRGARRWKDSWKCLKVRKDKIKILLETIPNYGVIVLGQ